MSSRICRQLEILALRSFELADRVAAGELELIDGTSAITEGMMPTYWFGRRQHGR
jgi:hypothetical protein